MATVSSSSFQDIDHIEAVKGGASITFGNVLNQINKVIQTLINKFKKVDEEDTQIKNRLTALEKPPTFRLLTSSDNCNTLATGLYFCSSANTVSPQNKPSDFSSGLFIQIRDNNDKYILQIYEKHVASNANGSFSEFSKRYSKDKGQTWTGGELIYN